MKKTLRLLALATGLILAGSVFAEEVGVKPEHKVHKHKEHKHGKKDCTHKAEKHGDHTDYEHDGHHHKKHGGHVDECDGPEAEAAKPAAEKASQ